MKGRWLSLVLASGGLVFAASSAAQLSVVEATAESAAQDVSEASDIRVEIRITRKATGEQVYFDSERVDTECPEWLCPPPATETPRSEGYARYSKDDACHNIERILSQHVQQGNGASGGSIDGQEFKYNTRIVLTRSLAPGEDRGTGILGPIVPTPPKCPDPDAIIIDPSVVAE